MQMHDFFEDKSDDELVDFALWAYGRDFVVSLNTREPSFKEAADLWNARHPELPQISDDADPEEALDMMFSVYEMRKEALQRIGSIYSSELVQEGIDFSRWAFGEDIQRKLLMGEFISFDALLDAWHANNGDLHQFKKGADADEALFKMAEIYEKEIGHE